MATGDWQQVSVLKKARLIQVPTNTIFDLKNYTNGVLWGTTSLEVSISSVDMGYNNTSLEVSFESLGNNQYRTHIYRYRIVSSGSLNHITVPVTGSYQQYDLGQYCGGASINGTIVGGGTGDLVCYLGYATPRYPSYNFGSPVIDLHTVNASSTTVNKLFAPPILGNTLLYYAGAGNVGNNIQINFTPYYLGGKEEVNGVTNVLALEV